MLRMHQIDWDDSKTLLCLDICREWFVMSKFRVQEADAQSCLFLSCHYDLHGEALPIPTAYSAGSSPAGRVNIAAVPLPGARLVFFFAASSAFSASMLFT